MALATAAIDIIFYHNLNCGTSRNTLALIRNAAVEPDVIEYLTTPPSRELLLGLVRRMAAALRSILREKSTPFADLDLGRPELTDADLLFAISRHPILINRPIVVRRGA